MFSTLNKNDVSKTITLIGVKLTSWEACQEKEDTG